VADVWVAPIPKCPVHNARAGTMRLDFAMDTWVCRGWDGEGCDHQVREEDRHHQYTYLGTTDAPGGLPPVLSRDWSSPP
jgi:hypothetical protein